MLSASLRENHTGEIGCTVYLRLLVQESENLADLGPHSVPLPTGVHSEHPFADGHTITLSDRRKRGLGEQEGGNVFGGSHLGVVVRHRKRVEDKS